MVCCEVLHSSSVSSPSLSLKVDLTPLMENTAATSPCCEFRVVTEWVQILYLSLYVHYKVRYVVVYLLLYSIVKWRGKKIGLLQRQQVGKPSRDLLYHLKMHSCLHAEAFEDRSTFSPCFITK